MSNDIKLVYDVFIARKHSKFNDFNSISKELNENSDLKKTYEKAKEDEAFKLIFNIYPKNDQFKSHIIELYDNNIIKLGFEPTLLNNISYKNNRFYIQKKNTIIDKIIMGFIGLVVISLFIVSGLDIFGIHMSKYFYIMYFLILLFSLVLTYPLYIILNYRWQEALVSKLLSDYNDKKDKNT